MLLYWEQLCNLVNSFAAFVHRCCRPCFSQGWINIAIVVVAVSVAIIEELVFRGFIQGQISKLNIDFAMVFAAFAHASYKACLFLSPAAIPQQHLVSYFIWSFGAYVVLGFLKNYSKSIVPVIIAHVIFDLIVYAEVLQAPWWVW